MKRPTLNVASCFCSPLLVFGLAIALTSCSSLKKDEITEAWETDEEEIDPTPEELVEIARAERDESEIRADMLARRTFPLVRNEFVDAWIDYFTKTKRGRASFRKWLSRSTRYIPIIRTTLKKHGLPEDLIYLSMIESGFNPRAYSRAHAVGPWQFIRGTGKRYGLRIDYFVDERRDIQKSTVAAATYLKELYQIFGSWYLAAASYNAGEGRTLNAIRRDRTRNFWELTRRKSNFRRETRNYVPKIIAAAIISKNPESFGFTNIEYEEPLEWKLVDIPQGVDLRSVAKVAGVPIKKLRLLNAELPIGITPPDAKGPYPVKVPPESKERLIAGLSQLKARKVSHFIVHRVRRGENLGAIARRYRSRVRTLMELNKISNPRRIQIGQRLRVPIPLKGGNARTRNTAGRSVASTKKVDGYLNHKVRRGETLSEIAERYKVRTRTIMQLNGIRNARTIRAGQWLKIRPKS